MFQPCFHFCLTNRNLYICKYVFVKQQPTIIHQRYGYDYMSLTCFQGQGYPWKLLHTTLLYLFIEVLETNHILQHIVMSHKYPSPHMTSFNILQNIFISTIFFMPHSFVLINHLLLLLPFHLLPSTFDCISDATYIQFFSNFCFLWKTAYIIK